MGLVVACCLPVLPAWSAPPSSADIDAQIDRVFANLQAVVEEAGGSFDEIVKVNVYLTDLANFAKVNEAMAKLFSEPYPARAVVGVAELPRGALVEVDAVMELTSLSRGVEDVG